MKEILKEAMDDLKRRGIDYADARRVRTLSEILVMKNGVLETASLTESEGFGVRVLNGGAWGFSSSSELTPEKVSEVADRALSIAKASAAVGGGGVLLDGQRAVVDSLFRPGPHGTLSSMGVLMAHFPLWQLRSR